MKKLYLFITCIVLLILDTSLSSLISIKGIYPNLLFVFAISISIICGPKTGLLIGLLSGACQDLFFFEGFGVNTLINMWLCYIVGYIGKSIWKEKRVIPLIMMFVATILRYIGIFIIMNVVNKTITIDKWFYVALYNCIIMALAYGKIYRKCNEDDNEFSWRFKVK